MLGPFKAWIISDRLFNICQVKLQIKSAGNTVDLFHVHKFEQFLLQQIAETVLVAQSVNSARM